MRIECVRVALTLVVTLLFLAPDARACHGATKPCHSHKVVHCQPCCSSTRVIKKTRTVVIDCPDPCLEITCPPGYRPDTVNGVITCILLPLAKPCGPNEIPLYTGKGTYICYDTTKLKEPQPPTELPPPPPPYDVVCPPCHIPDTNGTVITCIRIIGCNQAVDSTCPPGSIRICTSDTTFICINPMPDTTRSSVPIRWEEGRDVFSNGVWYRLRSRKNHCYVGKYIHGKPTPPKLIDGKYDEWRRGIQKLDSYTGPCKEYRCEECEREKLKQRSR